MELVLGRGPPGWGTGSRACIPRGETDAFSWRSGDMSRGGGARIRRQKWVR
jgi:hypothetical protein